MAPSTGRRDILETGRVVCTSDGGPVLSIKFSSFNESLLKEQSSKGLTGEVFMTHHGMPFGR